MAGTTLFKGNKNGVRGVEETLIIRGGHRKGRIRNGKWRKGYYTVEVKKFEKNGYYAPITSDPFAEGNFIFSIGTGRKTTKKLEAIEEVLERNVERLADLWKEGQYKEMMKDVEELTKSIIK